MATPTISDGTVTLKNARGHTQTLDEAHVFVRASDGVVFIANDSTKIASALRRAITDDERAMTGMMKRVIACGK